MGKLVTQTCEKSYSSVLPLQGLLNLFSVTNSKLGLSVVEVNICSVSTVIICTVILSCRKKNPFVFPAQLSTSYISCMSRSNNFITHQHCTCHQCREGPGWTVDSCK